MRLRLSLAFASLCTLSAQAQPISLHPENPHYFQFRGKPTVLITSGEHYGAVLNLDFDFAPYLDELMARGLNQTRLFSGTYREVAGSFKIQSNDLSPRPGQFLGPYARTDQAGAADGNKFDLDRWEPAYFQRLREFVKLAGEKGVVVEYVLFCPFYEESLWAVNAWNPRNNINKTPSVPSKEVYTLEHPAYVALHEAFVKKVVTELNEFDNVYFEICNEPYFGGVTLPWQRRIAEAIASTEKPLPKKHLIAQNIANGKARISDPDPNVSLFNFHYARPPETVPLNYGLNKALGDDETGFQGTGDRVYRTEAWSFLLSGGALFSHLDYSFTVDHEDGTAPVVEPTPGGGGPTFRAQLQFLAEFMNRLPFIKMRPAAEGEVSASGSKAALYTLVEPGRSLAAYLPESPGPISIRIKAGLLKPGRYRVEWFDPVARRSIGASELSLKTGEAVVNIPHTAGREDLALTIRALTD